MYTRMSQRGQNSVEMIVERIETLPRIEGEEHVVLGKVLREPFACTVYERAVCARGVTVLDYPDSKWSVFYEKNLIPSGRRSP